MQDLKPLLMWMVTVKNSLHKLDQRPKVRQGHIKHKDMSSKSIQLNYVKGRAEITYKSLNCCTK